MLRPSVALLAATLAGACSPNDEGSPAPVELWEPGVMYPSAQGPRADGLLELRGIIHAHSVYSHDACDGEPAVDGVRDAQCAADFREGVCASLHDFVFLTDHPADFQNNEFPDVLLYDESLGDELLERNGGPVASWSACPDGHRALTIAGLEGDTMPVGLEGHAADRELAYHSYDTASIDALRAKGAVVLVSHTESWTAPLLATLPIDGFEMFNMHANALVNMLSALEMLVMMQDGEPGMPVPDLTILPMISEDPRYVDIWSETLARGVRRVTVMATDVHRNTFPQLLADGERVDSYRRMMIAFSNHLLITPNADGTWDDRNLKEALREGRLFGVFEVMGHPVGFDYRAEGSTTSAYMGGEIDLADEPELVVDVPTLRGLDPDVEAPEISARILRAGELGWEEVAAGSETLRFSPDGPGAYRAVIDMAPRHLSDDLGAFADRIATVPRVWIYANPIYVH